MQSDRQANAIRHLTVALLVVGLVLAAHGLVVLLRHRVPLLLIQGPAFWGCTLALAACVVLVGLALLRVSRRLRGPGPGGGGFAPLRHAFVVAVVGWLLFLALVQPFQRLWFDVWAGACAGAWAALLLVPRPATSGRVRFRRVFGFVGFTLCLSAVGVELGLRVYARLSPSPLLARVGAGPRDILERFRCAPGQMRYGFPCNSRGYYDTEFLRKQGEQRLIVAIGDSFGVGAVPHGRHYTTLCEERIRAPIYNMGIVGIGPPEYLVLLVEEALPLAPDEIVVGIFVGNDLTAGDVTTGLPDPLLRDWFQRERVLSWVLPRRLARISAERQHLVAHGAREREEPGPSPGQPESAQPWLADPLLEEGTLSSEAFLQLETERALSICGQDPAAFAFCTEMLLAMQRAAGSVPLRVLLIPDEFQVEDELWDVVQGRAGRELDRDRPQRFLRRWLEEHGIPYLDLLPVLRGVPALADGKRHVYHREDTHWNARGNRVVAEALAEVLGQDGEGR